MHLNALENSLANEKCNILSRGSKAFPSIKAHFSHSHLMSLSFDAYTPSAMSKCFSQHHAAQNVWMLINIHWAFLYTPNYCIISHPSSMLRQRNAKCKNRMKFAVFMLALLELFITTAKFTISQMATHHAIVNCALNNTCQSGRAQENPRKPFDLSSFLYRTQAISV